MPIEFREVRRGEIDDAHAFAVDQGADVAKGALRHQLSLVALNAEKTILGSALHEVADDGRRHILIHLKPDIHPGLGRLLIDRALRKAEAADLATTRVTVHHDEADQTLWSAADWLVRLRPATPTPSPSPAAPLTTAKAAEPAHTLDASASPKPPADAQGSAKVPAE